MLKQVKQTQAKSETLNFVIEFSSSFGSIHTYLGISFIEFSVALMVQNRMYMKFALLQEYR